MQKFVQDVERIIEIFRKYAEYGFEILHPQLLLEKIVEGKRPNAYIGYETSSTEIHWGNLIGYLVLRALDIVGINTVILLADTHAKLNGKQNYPALKNFFDRENAIPCIFGSDFQFDREYVKTIVSISSKISLKKMAKSLMKSEVEKLTVADYFYSLFQAQDIDTLKIDIAIGATDQRKIHMLHNDKFRKITYIHFPLILNKGVKMSKSIPSSIVPVDAPLNKVLEVIPIYYQEFLADLYNKSFKQIVDDVQLRRI